MIFIIRQPTNVYPSLGNAVDGSLATNIFSFTFSGDKLYSYQIFIYDAITNDTVYTGSVVPLELYNGETFEHTMSDSAFTNGLDLIWKARLTQSTTDMKIVSSTCQTGSTTTSIKIRPNSAIKIGMNMVIGSQTKAISAFTNYYSKSNSTLSAGSTYNVIKIATGLTESDVVQYTLMIGTQKRTIIAYDTSTGEATVSPAFTSLYDSGTAYIIADENVAVATTSAFTSAPDLGDQYTVYTAFIDTPNYFFKSRDIPSLRIFSPRSGLTLGASGTITVPIMMGLVEGSDMQLTIGAYDGLECGGYVPSTGIWSYISSPLPSSFPEGTAYTVLADVTSPVFSRTGTFEGKYYQDQGAGIKYHIFNLYDESSVLLDTTGQVYNGLLEYTYDAFVSGVDYSIELIVVTQENVEVTTGEETFSVSYGVLDLNAQPTLINLEDSNAIQIDWLEDKTSVGIASGTVSYESDFPFAGTNSLNIETGEVVFDNISNLTLEIPLMKYTIFTNINTPIINEGTLISLDDAPSEGGSGSIALSMESFLFYNEISDPYYQSIYAPYTKTEIVLDDPIPLLSGQTVTGTPAADTGYIWDDTDTWDDTQYWTETDPTDTIQLKVTMISDYDIQVEHVTAP